jgi:hypothetical protein
MELTAKNPRERESKKEDGAGQSPTGTAERGCRPATRVRPVF